MSIRWRKSALFLLGILGLCSFACAQARQSVKSPEVHADGKVTFRLAAPNARKVLLEASFAAGNKGMTRNGRGVWAITLGPLNPGILGYRFNVDGLRILDPKNPEGRLGNWPESTVTVPARPPAVYALQAVPHGEVHRHYYASKSLAATRRLFVYLPPGYAAAGAKRYPVLYLLHGSGDDASTWSRFGRAPLILDNLIAAGKAVPMIVVMPYGHARLPGVKNSSDRANRVEAFSRDLLQDIMPLVDKRYRTATGPGNRAIVGLSMGGGQSLRIGLNHPELFHWVGGFSSYLPGDMKALFPVLDARPDRANKTLKTLWVGCGKDDFLLSQNQAFNAFLKQKQIRHVYRLTEGGHSWPVWRGYLAEFAPLLFKKGE